MIKMEAIHIQQGDFSLEDIKLTIPSQAYAVLMGGSGTGKTSLMEALCGLRKISSGAIFINDKNISNMDPWDRKIGYVPQDGALFPHLSAGEQIAFPLTIKKSPHHEINKTVTELAELMEITSVLNSYPNTLSGGEKQRVALARALAMGPEVLCFDEPLSALDEELHDEISQLLAKLVKLKKLTVLHITHSMREAQSLGSIIFKLSKGEIINIPKETHKSYEL